MLSCHGSGPAHLCWLSSGTTMGKAQGTAGTWGHGCTQGPSRVASPQPCTVGDTSASTFLLLPSLTGMHFAISRAVSHCFVTSLAFFFFSISLPRQDSGYPERAEVSWTIRIRERRLHRLGSPLRVAKQWEVNYKQIQSWAAASSEDGTAQDAAVEEAQRMRLCRDAALQDAAL